MLLPVIALSRRADLAEVIGVALAAKARGWGFRPIASALGRPAETVRGWLRRFAVLAGVWRRVFTELAVDVGVDAVMPDGSGLVLADAVAAIVAAWFAAAGRFALAGRVSLWRFAAAVTGGRLLAPAAVIAGQHEPALISRG